MLKSLDLFGFKSFADRTRFDFALGVTVVVGPNGSGKSNVVDAIKWILGDQSPKSLRGKEMTDVIFNGSTGRKPSAFAEASLTFNNTSRFLPLDVDEVTIGRRLWRNGDSEYLINGAASRLKDIKDVFAGTGAATSAYSIIEQGRVDQILHANAAARRLVFEEAAGISRFKQRKVDALKKLERVTQNLLRLTDIVQQLESQLNSTRNQAAKAAKYREISEELKTVWLGLAADDHGHFAGELEKLDARLAEFGGEISEFTGQQEQIESRLASFDHEISAVEDQLRDAERNSSANRELVVSQESTIRHATSRLRELDSELVRLRRQRGTTESQLKDVADELTSTTTELDTFDDTYLAQQSVLQQHDEHIAEIARQLNELRQKLETRRRDRAELAQQTTDINQRVALLQAQIEQLQHARQQLTERRDSLSGEIDGGQVELSRRQAAVNEVLSKSSVISESFQSIRSKQKKLLKEQESTQQRLAELREKRSAAQARLHVLEDLEQRQEGLAIGVKEILNRARSSNYEPWNRILGSVADLLDVDLDNAALLEVALGSRAQLIVMDDVAPLVDYFNKGGVRIEGRVGFMSLNATSNAVSGKALAAGLRQVPAASALPLTIPPSDPDIVRRADELVSETCGHRELAAKLLANTFVVTSLEAAFRLSVEHGAHYRYVTLQGELLEPDGTLYAGSLRGETAILSRKSELRRLKNDIIRLDQGVDLSEKQIVALANQLTAIETEMTSAAAARDEINDKLSQLKSEFESQHKIVDRLTKDRADIDGQLAANAAQAAEAEHQLLRGQGDRLQAEETQQVAAQDIARLEQQFAAVDESRQQRIQQQTEEKLKLAKKEERRSGLTKTVQRLREESKSRQEQAEEVSRRHKQLAEQRRTTELQLLNATGALAELAIGAERLSDDVALIAREKGKMRSIRAELGEEDTRIRQARRAISDQQHEAELRAREIRHQLATCGQRIEEEYGLTLDQVVASGASAYRELLVARGLVADPESESAQEGEAPAEPHDVTFESVRTEIEEDVNRLRRKLKAMGSVNTDSLKEIEELEAKYEHFHAQHMDLTEAKDTLEEIIKKVNQESKRIFTESFDAIRKEFRELFRKLFGGGDGDVILEDPDDVLDCGIDIVARPPGKELRSITLLSGGEKTLTAVALLLAIFKSRPSPFCILDEVDAALDDGNVERYASVVREFRNTTQFIVISHRKRTMTAADVIYGVTMEQSGVSKRMSVRFEDVDENGDFRTPPGAAQAA